MSRSGNLLIDQDPVRTALNALTESSDQFRLLNEESHVGCLLLIYDHSNKLKVI